jgi:glycerophosphoryl diester phosphodiesterase
MKELFYISVFSLLLLACQSEKHELDNIEDKVLIIGHGGMGVDSPYPMNTAESILKCLATGAHGSEIDVQMTKDSVLVAYHDADLSTLTNLSGPIISKTWKEIQEAVYMRSPYLKYRVANIDSLFNSIANIHDYLYSFDIKGYSNATANYNPRFARALIRLIEKYEISENTIIESQDKDFINMMQAQKPNCKILIYMSDFEKALEFALAENLYGITMSTRLITKEQIKKAHENNLRVALWNLHSNRSAREAIRKNADMIQVEKLDAALRMVE